MSDRYAELRRWAEFSGRVAMVSRPGMDKTILALLDERGRWRKAANLVAIAAREMHAENVQLADSYQDIGSHMFDALAENDRIIKRHRCPDPEPFDAFMTTVLSVVATLVLVAVIVAGTGVESLPPGIGTLFLLVFAVVCGTVAGMLRHASNAYLRRARRKAGKLP